MPQLYKKVSIEMSVKLLGLARKLPANNGDNKKGTLADPLV
jgi:hypothetical protein